MLNNLYFQCVLTDAGVLLQRRYVLNLEFHYLCLPTWQEQWKLRLNLNSSPKKEMVHVKFWSYQHLIVGTHGHSKAAKCGCMHGIESRSESSVVTRTHQKVRIVV